MAVIEPHQFRNITFVGHGGSGKTSLAEAVLFKTGTTKRLGSVVDKTSILDCTDEEREKLSSIESAAAHLSYKDLHVNLIDTPGIAAFCGPSIASMAAAECAVLVISAASGIQVNTRKMFAKAKEYGLGIWIVINHIDAPNVDIPELLAAVQESFGAQCVPINLPCNGSKGVTDCFVNESGDADFSDVGEAHTAIIEAVVGADDALMEKYLGGELSDDEAKGAAANAVATGEFMPIFFTDSLHDVGITEFLDSLESFCPSPISGKKRTIVDGENVITIEPKPAEDFIGQVFKISTDAKSNIKHVTIRAYSGTLTHDQLLKSEKEPKGVRPGHVTKPQSAEYKEIDAGVAGDIISLSKLDLHIGDMVYACPKPIAGTIEMPKCPEPMFSLALISKTRGDEDKISATLRRYAEEDPCFIHEHGMGGELIVRGMGEQQIRTYLTRMHNHQKLDVDTKPPRIPYRETITASAKNVEYTHKKQSGGSGEFGRVIINMIPAERGEGYEFVDKIFGGAIDQAYRPSVDKGVKASMVDGVLAGYPIVDLKVELIDGKTHPVDSKDVAFQKAGKGAFREAFMKAKPVLLEPIVDIEVTVPADHMGDITGDLASRRGRPSGQEMLPGNMASISAIVPLAELAASPSNRKSGGRYVLAAKLEDFSRPIVHDCTNHTIA